MTAGSGVDGGRGVRVVLRAAADLVARVGLCPPGEFWHEFWPGYDEDRCYRVGDPVSLFGALIVAAERAGAPWCGDAYWWRRRPRVVAAVLAVARYLGVTATEVAEVGGPVWEWSAADGRTPAEVAAVLRGAAGDTAADVVAVTSFGYRHLTGPVPAADVTVDVREHLRDPQTDPAFRSLTGDDSAVVERVEATPGAAGLLDALTDAVLALAPGACVAGRVVRVAIGCAGGRHRSVVLATTLADRFAPWGAELTHLHLRRPVVGAATGDPTPQGGPCPTIALGHASDGVGPAEGRS